jgi:hypothetical protein
LGESNTGCRDEVVISRTVKNEVLLELTYVGKVGIMFSIGEQVCSRKTRNVGKVIGYGHEVIDSGYTLTLKVLIAKVESPGRTTAVEEDLYSNWIQHLNF